MFHITFPEVWTQNDIVNHFRKYGSVFIRWINNTSAFVALNNRENAPILLKTITATKGVKITTFAAHLRATGAESDDDVRKFTSNTLKQHCSSTFLNILLLYSFYCIFIYRLKLMRLKKQKHLQQLHRNARRCRHQIKGGIIF